MYAVEELVADGRFLAALRASVEDPRLASPGLREAKIKITSRCNLRCAMCRYGRRHQERALPTDTWRRILDELRELGCAKVHFSGGEAFLRPDFTLLLEHARALGLKVNLTSNGTLIGRETAARLAAIGLNGISISLDGPSARLHDRIRGCDGAFRRSIRAIRRLTRSAGKLGRPLKLRINTVLLRGNFRLLPDMVHLAARLGASDLVPMPVDAKGEVGRRLTRAQILEYNREVAPRVLVARRDSGFPVQLSRVFPFGVTPAEVGKSRDGLYARGFFASRRCLAPWLHTFIAWDGRVYLCCMTNGRTAPLGEAASQPLREIFSGPAYRSIRESFSRGASLPPCQRCDLFLRENARLDEALSLGRDRRLHAGCA